MAIPELSGVEYAVTGAGGRPLLVLGPSLGTSAATLWEPAARVLAERFDVVAWDLPGHGTSRPATGFSMADLADGVEALAARAREVRGDPGAPYWYAGDSVGGCVGLQLAITGRLAGLAAIATGARVGDPAGWADRAAQVRASGTASMVEGSAQRWFGPGFADREPGVADALLTALRDVDDESYAAVCEALGGFDVRDRLSEIDVPVLAVAGEADAAVGAEQLELITERVRRGTLATLPGVGHLPPAEAPERTAELITRLVAGRPGAD
ncbi:alpha/beta fold hydrolase [Naumannella huperziae]